MTGQIILPSSQKKVGRIANCPAFLTEAGKDWTITEVAPYVAHLLEHFGPERLVWGSDWPVLTKAASYENLDRGDCISHTR